MQIYAFNKGGAILFRQIWLPSKPALTKPERLSGISSAQASCFFSKMPLIMLIGLTNSNNTCYNQ